MIGDKKSKLVSSAIEDPKTGKLVVNANKIKEVTLKYCMDTLKNNEPEEPFRKEIDDKKYKVSGFLNESEGEFEATKEVFDFNVNKFKKAGKKNYVFFTKSGQKFQDAVYNLCQKMFRFETFPETFTETTLHMIWKAKGKQTNLDSNRFIHCKPWLPRAAESLIVA